MTNITIRLRLLTTIGIFLSVICALAHAFAAEEMSTMSPDTKEMVLSPFKFDGVTSVTAIKLIEVKNLKPLVVYSSTDKGTGFPSYRTHVSGIAVTEQQPEITHLFTIPQLLPPPPAWDIVGGSQIPYWFVYESAGGAVNALVLESNKGDRLTVTSEYPFAHFTLPRFARGYMSPQKPVVSAIADNNKAVVFFCHGGDKYVHYRELCKCADATLIRYEEHFGLFYKTFVAGPSRNDVIPGVLNYVDLEADLSFAGPPLRLLENRVVFEFDVDVRGGEFFLVATAGDRLNLVRGTLGIRRFDAFTVSGKYNPDTLTRPTIMVGSRYFCVAVLEQAQTQGARLLIGTAPIVGE